MKSGLLLRFILVLLLASAYSGCSKEDYLPGLTGNMVGYLYTFDQFGRVLADHSQVKITAKGLDRSFTAHSDQNGRFRLEEVPTGTYELHFEKEGFGVLKQFGVQHLGGKATILPFIDSYEHAYFLYEMSTTTITDLSIVDDSISVHFSFTTLILPDLMRIRIYFSSVAGFARSEAEFIDSRTLRTAGENYTVTLNFHDAPFEQGEIIYVRACCITEVGAFHPPLQNYRTIYGVDTYFDYESNETIYPNSGEESAQYSFIFPE